MGYEFSNYCNADGAQRLKQHIEEFWQERGYIVNVTLVQGSFTAALRFARTDVRSDMINGLPLRKVSVVDGALASTA